MSSSGAVRSATEISGIKEASGSKRKRSMRTLNSVQLDIQPVVGKGTFGLVFKATEIETGDRVALKKIFMEKELHGFPITAIREIKILKALDHENVVKLKDVVTYDNKMDGPAPDASISHGDVMMMFEFCDFDLSGMLKKPEIHLTEDHIRSYTKQILEGVHYMHKNKILHRDIKGANILVTRDNIIKIADWGLARSYYDTEKQKLTNQVVTLWYRCPELILGSVHYGPEIDIWSVGCLFAEMKSRTHSPLLPSQCKDLDRAESEMKQLELIYRLLGTPTGELEEYFRNSERFPNFEKYTFSCTYTSKVSRKRDEFGQPAVDLLAKLIDMDPRTRISAKDALEDDYFWCPQPCPSPQQLRVFDGTAFSMSEDARRDAEYRRQVEEKQRKAEEKERLDKQRAEEKAAAIAATAMRGPAGGGGGRGRGPRSAADAAGGEGGEGGYRRPPRQMNYESKFKLIKKGDAAATVAGGDGDGGGGEGGGEAAADVKESQVDDTESEHNQLEKRKRES